MFDLFRSRDKAVRILLGGLLLLVALSMLTYLVPSYNTGGSASDVVVAEIGKDTITLPELQQVIQMNLRGRQLPPEIMPNYIPQFVNQMVTERALAYEANRLGYKVSDADLASAIRSTIPQLFQDGKFAGKDVYSAILAQQNMTIPQFESEMSRQLLVNKLKEVALEGTIVTPQEIEREYKRKNDKVKIAYVKISADKLQSQVQITPEEMRKYYESNKSAFQTPEKRDVGILLVDQAKLEQSIQPTDADLLRAYNDNKDNFRTPERVNIRHILLKTSGPQDEAAKKAKAEDLIKQIKGGANFADLAKKYSEDPGSAAKGGEYDGVVRGQMVPEFEKAAFSLKPGEISEPVKTQYGYHIIQVISHEPARLQPFEEVKAKLAEDYKKQRVTEVMQQTADKAQAALTKDPSHPEQVATSLGIQYIKADKVAAGQPLPQIGMSRELDDAISSLKKGEVSQPVVLTGNTRIAIADCMNVMPAHPAAFDEVQDRIRDNMTRERVSKMMDDKAAQLAEKARSNGGNLEAAAKAMGLEVKTSNPVDRAGAVEGLGSAGMLPDAFTKPAGSIVGPNPVPDGRVVAKIVEQLPADMAGLASQRAAIRDELKNQKNQNRTGLFEEGVRDALTKEGKIKIHQDVINRLLASYQRS